MRPARGRAALAAAAVALLSGEPSGEVDAFRASNGELLWQFQTGSGVHGSPMTYSVGGRQYVAVATGWGGWMKGFAPELIGQSRGTALFVFALPQAGPAATGR